MHDVFPWRWRGPLPLASLVLVCLWLPPAGWAQVPEEQPETTPPLAEPAQPLPAGPASEGMRVRAVEIVGLVNLSEGYVRNQLLKVRPGQPYALRDVETDVRELLRSRKFVNAYATTRPEEGEIVVIYHVLEKPEIASVELEGNKAYSAAKLYELTPVAGSPLDRYEVERGRQDIEQKYKEDGYYYAQVTLDEAALEQESRVIYRIVEGPRVRVKKILVEGNHVFGTRRLLSRIESRTYIWLLEKGALDEDKANRDALAIQQYYRDEAFLDARVGYRLEFDPVRREDVQLIFVVEEGDRYRVKEATFTGNEVYENERVTEALGLPPETFIRDEALQAGVKRVQDLYGENGYVVARIDVRKDFLEEPGYVVLRVLIDEGNQARVGRITIHGNVQTKDEVVRRELRFYPGEIYNTTKLRRAEQDLRETWLFRPDSVAITPLEEIDGEREALVKVEETETVQFLVGVGVSTDNGVIGTLTVDNRNFDLFDWPRTWEQFFRGQAFRGAGQRLVFTAEPGTEVSRFSIRFTEPYFLGRPVRFDTSVYLFQRARDAYDEQRVGFTVGLSRRFRGGLLDGWALEGSTRFEGVNIDNVDGFAARDIRDAKGSGFLTALKVGVVRDTTDSRVLPTEGYRFGVSWEQVGALGGDYTFGKPALTSAWYKTLRTDILDRKSVLALRGDVGYIVGDAPVFERYYGGGFGSLRGFSYRGVTPRGGIQDNAIGGDFIVLTGAEYSFPLYGKQFRGVTFLDMGAVERDFELTTWRASVGFGLRVQVDFFGPVPIVLDFGFPVAKGGDDEDQIFNFAVGASF